MNDTTYRTDSDLAPFLSPGQYVDSDHPDVVRFARASTEHFNTRMCKAVALYYAVRDGFLYDPYRIDQSAAGFRASRCIATGRGYCVTKAALLAAAARAIGIPARLGFADVRNHLTSPRLSEIMGTDVFAYHGYAELYLDGRWVKATPAFNLSLCEKAGILPLEFDGTADSIFHPFDAAGRKHMEYLLDRGTYADVPRESILAVWRELYPGSAGWGASEGAAEFEQEARGAG